MIIDLCIIHDIPSPPVAVLGDVTFIPSPDRSVTSYTAEIRPTGSSTVVATQALGLPQPDNRNVITVNLATTLNALAAGNYDVSILATNPSGSTDSGISNEFTVPLS